MASLLARFTKRFGIEIYGHGFVYDGGTNNRGIDNVGDNQSELRNVDLQPEIKRRKVQEYLYFKNEYVNRINSWLDQDKINTIGIHGMAGVGKTALAKEVYARVSNGGGICYTTGVCAIGWVSVGVAFSVYQLQQKIAGVFGVDLQGDEDETRRAAMIHAFLCRKDKCVIFLDDLWGDFRREDVGIPKKCKMVVISRLLDVCRVLCCEKVLEVEPLSEDETWQLFHHSIGYADLSDKEVSRIRKLVYDKCVGIPLAITELANRLRKVVDDNGLSWRDVFEDADPISMGPTYLEDTFSQLKMSYERLNNVKLQRCFLYSALYPKGYAISKEKLICLWIGERLIDDVSSVQAQYDMGHTILNKLINSCLLEACDDNRRVKMNDLMRHMAISVAGDKFMVEAGMPTELEFREYLLAVSLINSLISPIPSSASLKCRCLSTLLLQHNSLELIPDSFFLHLSTLRVLNLSDTGIIRLPSSIGALEKLQVLDLSFCENLKQVHSLSKLLKLQFLDLSQTAIGQVPRSLEKLKGLKELNVSSIPEPIKIPNGVLPALYRLKRLACYVSVIHELQEVKTLEVLDARFSSHCGLSSYVRSFHWCILESYHLQVGCEVGYGQPYSRRVSVHNCFVTDLIVLPSNIQELYVNNCRDFHSLSDIMYPVGCDHENCQNNSTMGSCNADHIDQQAKVFSSLEVCTIRRCDDVETLFAPSWMGNLQALELLEVEDCGQLKEIIAEDVKECANRDVISLPQLKQLVLTRLPQMNSIYKGQVICASLLSCTFMDCPKLKRLAFSCMDDGEELFSRQLERIEGQEKWWEMLEWDQPKSKALLKPLFKCRSLE